MREILPFFPLGENLRCVLWRWGTSNEPQRAKLDFRMCSDSLEDPVGMTSLTHSLEGRARKLVEIAQSCVIRPRICELSWYIPCEPLWGEPVLCPIHQSHLEEEEVPQKQVEGKALSTHSQDMGSYRKESALIIHSVFLSKRPRAESCLPKSELSHCLHNNLSFGGT